MRLYAQTPARRIRQVLADLSAAALIYAAVKLALAVHDAIERLADPGRKAESAATASPTDLPTRATPPRRCRSSEGS